MPLICIIGILILTVFSFGGCSLIADYIRWANSPPMPLEERLLITFGIDLPAGMEVEFQFHENTGLSSGKAGEYIVLKAADDPTELIDNSSFITPGRYPHDYSERYKPFSEGRDSDFEKSFENTVNNLSRCGLTTHAKSCHLILPDEYYPKWEAEYRFAGVPAGYDGFYLIYFPETLRLVFLISGH